MKIVAIIVVLLLCSPAHSQGIKDTLFFSNGTMVIGKLKNVKLGVVTFDPDNANDITVQLRKLRAIAGGNKIFRVETVAHNLYFGKIMPHPDSNMMYVKSIFDTVAIDLEYISVMYPLDKSTLQRFSGNVGIGFSYTKSSDLGRLNVDTKIKYVSRKSEIILYFSGIYTIYDSLFSSDNENMYIRFNYNFIRNWFATAFVAYQRNLELGLERRYQEGVGIGNKFLTSRYIYAWGRGGLVINQEKSTEGSSSGVLTELFGQFEMNFFRFEKPELSFVFSQSFYYSLSQAGRFRNDGSLSVTWEIFNDFNLSFEPYNNYDSKPPVEGSHKFDYGVVFGIKYLFN